MRRGAYDPRMRSVVAVAVLTVATTARAFTVSSAISAGCHEAISTQALRQARATLATAGPLPATRDERALIDDAPFVIDDDLRDLAGATLLFAVRDNDLKGNDPLDTFDIVPIAADPALQREHCLRTPDEDEPDGSRRALADCAAFIAERTADALAGLGADGAPDPSDRVHLEVGLALRGPHVGVDLPRYWVRIGQAMHALEDGFTHNFRTGDGLTITAVLNWSDYADQILVEDRDGPPHARALDVCNDPDAPRARRHALAIAAATELLQVTLDPALGADEKRARFDALVARSLAYQPGCSQAGAWCDAAENGLRDANGCGCQLGAQPRGPATAPLGIALALAALCVLRRRARSLAIVLVLATSSLAAAQAPPPSPPPSPPPAPAPTGNGIEPGREVATPTAADVEKLRRDKRLGSRVGFYTALAGSFDRGALVMTTALRVRITERWIVGFDSEWNPWVSTNSPPRAGAINLAFTGIRRWPLTWERINLRSTLQLGTSILLFDVFGAPAGSVGLFAAAYPLGIDVDLGRGCRLVVDPLGVAVPIPHLTAAPFYYPQYRITIGFQFGS
jgi:hypothetical protein